MTSRFLSRIRSLVTNILIYHKQTISVEILEDIRAPRPKTDEKVNASCVFHVYLNDKKFNEYFFPFHGLIPGSFYVFLILNMLLKGNSIC